MELKRRIFTREFKVQIVREIEAGRPMVQLAREYQIHPTLLSRWQKEHLEYAEEAFKGNGNAYREEAKIAELERIIGQITMENALLKKTLLRLEGQIRGK